MFSLSKLTGIEGRIFTLRSFAEGRHFLSHGAYNFDTEEFSCSASDKYV